MRRTYALLYRLGLRPWDSSEVPATVVAFAAAVRPGIAVDLGCGTGAQARYLAAHGWRITAVDVVARAIEEAARNDPGNTVSWRVADVTDTISVDPGASLAGACDLLLDNGCLHGLRGDERLGWASTVHHLASPGATLLIRAAPPRRRVGIGPSGIARSDIDALLRQKWSPVSTGSGDPDWFVYRAAATDQ